jgi:hypothetical protein
MSLEASVHHYVDTLFAGYQAALREVAGSLVEPASFEVARIPRTIDRLLETLTAFALGHALRRVIEYAQPDEPALLAELATTIGALDAPQSDPPRRYLADADRRPMVEALVAALQMRLCLAARHARRVLLGVAATIAKHAPERGARFLQALDRMADPAIAAVFGDQLALGWQHFAAVVGGRPDPEIPDEPRWQRGRALWSAWSRRVRGTQAQDREAVRELPPGSILRVA